MRARVIHSHNGAQISVSASTNARNTRHAQQVRSDARGHGDTVAVAHAAATQHIETRTGETRSPRSKYTRDGETQQPEEETQQTHDEIHIMQQIRAVFRLQN